MTTASDLESPDERTAARRALLASIKEVALRYLDEFERPLGVTGEVAEYEAITLLKLTPAKARQPGWDAEGDVLGDGKVRRVQIKGRRIPADASRSQRVPGIVLTPEVDGVLLVLLDERYEATRILYHHANDVAALLGKPGSKARNERGSMAVSQFARDATVVYHRPA
jgi:hypothetical protein